MRVALLGDSHSAGALTPGGVLAATLRQAGYEVVVNAKGGRSASSFLHAEDGAGQLAALAAAGPYAAILVFLGTNEAAALWRAPVTADYAASYARTAAALAALRQAFAPALVIALGPPAWPAAPAGLTAAAAEIFALERQVFPLVIDVRTLTADLGADMRGAGAGIHFNAKGAAIVGARLAGAVRERLEAPRGAAGVPWWAKLAGGVAVGWGLLRWGAR